MISAIGFGAQYIPSAPNVAYEAATVSGGAVSAPRTTAAMSLPYSSPVPLRRPIFVIRAWMSQDPVSLANCTVAVLTDSVISFCSVIWPL